MTRITGKKQLLVWVALAGAGALSVSLGRADAPPGHYQIGTGPQVGTVYDTRTGLTWEGAPAASTYNLVAAQAYCADLGVGETDDWRLPSIKELQTLVDESPANPAIDLTAFPDAPSDRVHSSSVYQAEVEYGVPNPSTWSVDFSSGETETVPSYGNAYVRCVRP